MGVVPSSALIVLVRACGAAWAGIGLASACAMASPAPPRSDFNGDGFDDLAIGVPNLDVSGRVNAGAVLIINGSAAGPALEQHFVLTQASDGIPDSPEDSDRFSSALAWGDFNGDGFDDLAIGAASEDVDAPGTVPNAGSVTVVYGSPHGLDGDDGVHDAQVFAQGLHGLLGSPQFNDQFGWALAAGDFDGDGHDDLAISIIGQDLLTSDVVAPDAGAVQVLYGSANGLRAFADEVWTMNSGGVPGIAGPNNHFGFALATGDFNRDGRADLAIGAPGAAIAIMPGIGFASGAGAAFVIYGSQTGLNGSGSTMWSQNSTGIDDVADPGDSFGFALAAADFDGDGRDDLAVSAPFEDSGAFLNVGAVHVLRGSNIGLLSSDSRLLLGPASPDAFGFALAAGDFDHDGRQDLAVSMPRRPVGLVGAAGAVVIFRGSGDRLVGSLVRTLTQDSQGILDRAEPDDRFGESLWTGDFNGDGASDLAVGSPRENIGVVSDAGAINVVFGGTHGLTQRGDRFISGASGGLAEVFQTGAMLGWSVKASP